MTTSYDYDLFVIGGGSGGVRALRFGSGNFKIHTGSGSVRAELTRDVQSGRIDTGSGSVDVRISHDLGASITIERFAEMARFNYGSTVIVLLPAGIAELEPALCAESAVRLGQKLAHQPGEPYRFAGEIVARERITR